MTPPFRNDLGGFSHLWFRRSKTISKRCWSVAIQPNQSAWCNVVVLVRKKDGGLWFCINFHHFNMHTKKNSYPLPRIQALESLVGAGHFSCLDLKLGFWQVKIDEALKQYTTFKVGNLGFFNVITSLLTLQCTCDVSKADAELPRQVKPHLLPYVPRQHNHVFMNCRGTPP